MNTDNSLEHIEKTENPIHAQLAIKLLLFNLLSVISWGIIIVVTIPTGLIVFIFEILLYFLFVHVIVFIICGIIGLSNLVLSYRKNEKRTEYQQTALPALGLLMIVFYILLYFAIVGLSQLSFKF